MTSQLIKCPYCQFDIPNSAIVCGHCTKELSLVKSMMVQNSALAEELSSLKRQFEELKSKPPNSSAVQNVEDAYSNQSAEVTELSEFPEKLCGAKGLAALIVILLMTSFTLVLMHWLLLFVYDVNLLALRIATVVIPLLIGTVSYRKISVHWSFNLLGALLMGVSSVFGMLGVTSYLDEVSFLPENIREWREAAEYGFAIASAFFTGLLIENWRVAHHISLKRSINMRLLIEKDKDGRYKAAEWTTQVQSLFTAVAPFVSAGTALISAVRVFAG